MKCLILAAIYGTLTGGQFVKAPSKVGVDNFWRGTSHITEAQANALGYQLLIDEPPACASNEYAVATGYVADGERIRRTYAKAFHPIAIPSYSVADLTFWAVNNGKADALVAWLKGAGLYEVYLTTQTFGADNEVFGRVKAAVVADGIVTQAELTEALAYALID